MATKKKSTKKQTEKKAEKAEKASEPVAAAPPAVDKIRATRKQKPRQWVVFGLGDYTGEPTFTADLALLRCGFATKESAEEWAANPENVKPGVVVYIDSVTDRPLCTKVVRTTSFGAA